MSKSSNELMMNDPYKLLHSYQLMAKTKSKAYDYSESYFRWLNKVLTYPLVVLSAGNVVISAMNIDPWAVMCVSATTLVLVGFERAITPRDKEHQANQVKTEYAEIASNINQFIMSNNRTKQEIKDYGEIIHEQLNIWNGLSPPLKASFLQRAKAECVIKKKVYTPGSIEPIV